MTEVVSTPTPWSVFNELFRGCEASENSNGGVPENRIVEYLQLERDLLLMGYITLSRRMTEI